MAQDRIDSIIDIPAVKKEFDQVLEMLDKLGVSIKNSSSPSGMGSMAQSLTDRKNAMKDLQVQTEQLIATEKKLETQVDRVVASANEAVGANQATVASIKAYNGTLDENIKLQVQYKAQLADIKQRQKDLEKGFTGTAGAVKNYEAQMTSLVKQEKELQVANMELNTTIRNQVKEMNAAGNSLNELRAQLNQMKAAADSMDIGSEQFQEAQKSIGALNTKIKELEFQRGDFQRNVGNYAGTFSGAFNVLKNELESVREKIASFSGDKGSDAFKQLEKEEKLLTELTQNLGVTFGSTRQELRALQETAKRMGVELGVGSEAFQTFKNEVGEAKDQIQDLDGMIKQAASDTKFFDGLIAAAQGLAGAYGVAAGAAEIFGDGNEDLQKKMVKFQAIMTVLQGLQQVQNALQKEGAAIQTLLAIRTALVTAAQKAYTFATGQAIAATNALKTAIASTGIGAALLVLGLFVSKMAEAAETTDAASKSLKDFDAALDDVKENLKGDLEIIDLNVKRNTERVKQRAGSEQEIANITKQSLQEQVAAYSGAVAKITALEDDLSKEIIRLTKVGGKGANEEIKKLEDQRASLRSERNANNDAMIKASFAMQVELEKDKTRAAENARKSQKGYSEAHIIDLEAEAAATNDTVSNEKKSYAERIAALDQYYSQQQGIIRAKAGLDSSAPNLTAGEKAKIEAQKNKELEDLQRQYNANRAKLSQAGADREIEIQTELIKLEQELIKKKNDQIANDEEQNVETRLAAYNNYVKAELTILEADHKEKVAKAKGNKEELFLIDKEYETAVLSLTIDANNKVNEIIKSAAEKRKQIKIDEANAFASKMNLGATNEYAADVIALNKSLREKKISIEEYNREREKLNTDFSTKQIHVEMRNIQDLLKYTKSGSQEEYELKKKYKDLELKLDDDATAKQIANKKKHQEALKEMVKAAKDATISLIEGSFIKEKNAIEDKIEAIEKNKAAEIDRIQSSTLSEQEKADKVKLIEAKAAADKENLERKKKQVDMQKAKFDRDVALFDIAINTAVAVSKAVKESPLTFGLPWSAVALATGALQAAAILAKPLPKFEKGTSSSPEGMAITDEKGPEMYIEPGGKTYMGSDKGPTLRYLKRGTRVIPHDEVNKMMLSSMISHSGSIDAPVSDSAAREIRGLKEVMYWQTSELSKAYKKQRSNNVKVVVMSDWNTYIQKAVRE